MSSTPKKKSVKNNCVTGWCPKNKLPQVTEARPERKKKRKSKPEPEPEQKEVDLIAAVEQQLVSEHQAVKKKDKKPKSRPWTGANIIPDKVLVVKEEKP